MEADPKTEQYPEVANSHWPWRLTQKPNRNPTRNKGGSAHSYLVLLAEAVALCRGLGGTARPPATGEELRAARAGFGASLSGRCKNGTWIPIQNVNGR
jgi:hypothetical protein